MKLTISSWFNEPEIQFQVSYKVDNLIRDIIIQDLLKPSGLNKDSDEDFLDIQITTKRDVISPQLSGPIFDKKNNFTNYSFWLPFEPIKESPNELESYLNFFFVLLKELLLKFEIPEYKVDDVESKVKSIVLNNPEYDYIKPDDKFDIEDILKNIKFDD